MSIQQATDPGASGEWFRTLEDTSPGRPTTGRISPAVAERRERFVRLVRVTMIGLVAFTLLGLGCFTWRTHAMHSALEAPPESPTVEH